MRPEVSGSSVALDHHGLYAPALDRLHELGMVPLGLVAIRFGEIRQRAIQRVFVAAVARDADRIAAARMGARQQGPAQ